ncbi:MAG: surface lipoprotein [Candidatus Pelagibacter sp. TMED166]|nr:MAG: surface lipoprotein [Candidatus Pelagibacter sp. TMED166]|tara:strand:- start:676 stop:1458 length:783 start_codon:yes stop_codon:yes gene_type:complete
MKKVLITILISFFVISSAQSGTDNENPLSGKNSEVKDCFEGVNRFTFALNQGLDKIIFKPVATAYRTLPSPIKTGTGNFVNNLSHLTTIPNNILQGEFKKAGTNLARITVNTTIGILGFFDVATSMGIAKHEKEDFGQTLGSMGVGEGCYLVLPVLGPSTVRDTMGLGVGFMGGDPWYNITVRNDTNYFKDSDYYFSKGTAGVDFRAKNIDTFDNLEKNSMDFYASVRSLYLQDRKQKILNTKKITETLDDSDWEEIENQ